jgi:polyisoprenoid-binding protein YceI
VLDLELGGLGEFVVDGTTHAGFEARGSIDRHAFGLHFGPLDVALGQKVEIVLDIQLVAPATS